MKTRNSRSQQLSQAERVLINPLNRSKSKQMYSFNRTRRFTRSKTESNLTHYYGTTNLSPTVALSFAKAKRDISKQIQVTPGPSEYRWSKDGQFNPKRTLSGTKGLGFTIGKAISEPKIRNIQSNTPTPAPGHYRPKSGYRSKNFSFFKSSRQTKDQMCLPLVSPDRYEVNRTTIDKLSNKKKIGQMGSPRIVNPSNSPRTKTKEVKAPLYYPTVTPRGLDLKKRKGGVIGSSRRMELLITESPGPADQQDRSQVSASFSEFPRPLN